jgi:phenylalanyl-tRNA synthetase beta chain
MKASIEWLKEFVDIDISVPELAEKMTMTGSKVENIEQKGNDIKNVVVGKILEINPHPNADKLIVTKVNVGNQTIQIVTRCRQCKASEILFQLQKMVQNCQVE